MRKTIMTRISKIVSVVNRAVTDPEEKARLLECLETDELTFDLGVETVEAGISFLEWPYRCLSAKEFKRGFRSAATLVEHPNLEIREDGEIIDKRIN
jgi:hypothetical protein